MTIQTLNAKFVELLEFNVKRFLDTSLSIHVYRHKGTRAIFFKEKISKLTTFEESVVSRISFLHWWLKDVCKAQIKYYYKNRNYHQFLSHASCMKSLEIVWKFLLNRFFFFDRYVFMNYPLTTVFKQPSVIIAKYTYEGFHAIQPYFRLFWVENNEAFLLCKYAKYARQGADRLKEVWLWSHK